MAGILGGKGGWELGVILHQWPSRPKCRVAWWCHSKNILIWVTFCIFTPTWGNDPIWRAYFSNGLVQPPTSPQWMVGSWYIGGKISRLSLFFFAHSVGCLFGDTSDIWKTNMMTEWRGGMFPCQWPWKLEGKNLGSSKLGHVNFPPLWRSTKESAISLFFFSEWQQKRMIPAYFASFFFGQEENSEVLLKSYVYTPWKTIMTKLENHHVQ